MYIKSHIGHLNIKMRPLIIKTKLILSTFVLLFSSYIQADHIPDSVLEIATRTIADPHASKQALENAQIIMESNGHAHGIFRHPVPPAVEVKISKNPFYYKPEEAPTHHQAPMQKEGLLEEKVSKPSQAIKSTNGMFQDVSALVVVKSLAPEGWEVKLEGTQNKLASTRINYYTEKSEMDSINEIVYGVGLKMKVFHQLKLIIITN